MKKKIAVAVSLLLVLALSVGGTIAWLTDSETVTNTFTIGNVDITLGETTGPNYKFVPGKTLAKDPKVTVIAGSEKCYVFVKAVESNVSVTVTEGENGETKQVTKGFSDFITYKIDDAAGKWNQLKDADDNAVDGVFYQVVTPNKKGESDTDLYILTDTLTTDEKTGSVTVNGTVTKDMVDRLGATELSLTFNAYAIQYEGTGTAFEAWKLLNQ